MVVLRLIYCQDIRHCREIGQGVKALDRGSMGHVGILGIVVSMFHSIPPFPTNNRQPETLKRTYPHKHA